MPQTIEQQNGQGGPEVDPDPSIGTPEGGGTGTPKAGQEKEKTLLVKPRTHLLVRQAANRLGRSNDAIIRRAIHLLNKDTEGQQAKKDDDWADEVAQ